MANFTISENPEYSEAIRKIEVSDPVHADLLNTIISQLMHNDAFIKKTAEQLAETLKNSTETLNAAIGTKANKSELHKVATSGKYDDLTGKPKIPVSGTCITPQGTPAKTVVCPDFTPYNGARVMVTFDNGSNTNYMTLNVNNTGAYVAWFPVGGSRAYNNEAISKFIVAGCAYEFVYQDGNTPKWVYCGAAVPAALPADGGTADTATKAVQDGNGNNIASYYEPKSNVVSKGSPTLPVYFDANGVTRQCSYSLLDGDGYSSIIQEIVFPFLGLPEGMTPNKLKNMGKLGSSRFFVSNGSEIRNVGKLIFICKQLFYPAASDCTYRIDRQNVCIMDVPSPAFDEKKKIAVISSGANTDTIYCTLTHVDGDEGYLYTAEPGINDIYMWGISNS